MDRREFVVVAGVALAASATGCVPSGQQRVVETPSSTYGRESAMGERVLVGYATRTGSTVGVAEAIGKTLSERGFAVDVKPLRERPSLAGYDAIVLGSAINGAAWLPEAMSFLEANAAGLRSVPTAVFCVHAMNTADTGKARTKRHAYLDKVREVVTPSAEGYFAGKGPDAKDTSLIARWAFRAFGGDTEGDARDWTKIAAWAQGLELIAAKGRG